MKHVMLLLAGVLFLSGCDSGNSSGKTPEQIQAEIEASQEKFAAEKMRIEAENQARIKQVEYQRSFVRARFLAVDAMKVTVELSNNTDKNIDNLSGSLDIIDRNGEYVAGIGLAHWVTGDIYLPAGKTVQAQKGLELMPGSQREKIIAEAEKYNYYFTASRIQYQGEAEFDMGLEAGQPVKKVETPVATITRPVEAAPAPAPETCGSNQVAVTISDQYYPGPECSHIGRNLDSERFMQKHILLCQEKTKAASPPPSVARVLITACGPAPGKAGIIYSKQICCDIP